MLKYICIEVKPPMHIDRMEYLPLGTKLTWLEKAERRKMSNRTGDWLQHFVVLLSLTAQLLGLYAILSAIEGHEVSFIYWLFSPFALAAVLIIVYDLFVFYSHLNQDGVMEKTISLRNSDWYGAFLISWFIVLVLVIPGAIYKEYIRKKGHPV